MKTISSKPSLTGQEFELDELLATNKSLAQQKRELHRQKLRQYSEKAVKLKEILKSSMDGSERKCLEGKLRALQQKQDAQITKLAKIDQIQKQIDQYMTEEDEEDSNTKKYKHTKKSQQKSVKEEAIQYSVNQNTPAKKLSQRHSIPLQQINQSEEANSLQRSTRSNFLGKSSAFTGKNQYSDKKAAFQNDSNDVRFKINDMQQKKHHNAKQFRAFSCWEPARTSFQRIKPTKSNANQLIPYEVEQRNENNKQSKFNKDYYLREQQQKLSTVMLSRKQSQARLEEMETRVSQLVQKERQLMKHIDNYEHEQSRLAKKCSNFIHSINRSKDIILSSGLILQQLSQMEINNRQLKSSHQFSIDSLESHATSEGSHGLSLQLASFEKMLQQFLLCAQREVMLTSGELQQCGLRVNRIREECANYEAKKRTLQGQLLKLDQSISAKLKQLALLSEQNNQLKQQVQQFDHFSALKKKLVAELQEKCDKLKVKKKVLSQKVEKIEGQLKTKQEQYANLLQISKEAACNVDQLRHQQKQIQEMLIFTEREIQKIKDIKSEQESELERYQSKLSQVKNAHQKILLQIGQNQKRLVEIQSQLTAHSAQESSLHDRIRKLQRQLNQSTNILDDQRAIITNQNDQINSKSNQLLEWQKKIIAVADSHRAIQAENTKLSQSIRKYKQEIEELKTQKEEIYSAKVELEEILSEVISKKQAMIAEIDIRSGELQTLLSDLMQGHEQLKSTSQKYERIEQDLKKHNQQYASISERLEEVKEELEEKMDEEANIIGRVNKLKLVQRQMLLEIGLKGTNNKLDEEIKGKISEAISQLEIVSKLKGELKECKYQNRKLRLDNQRLAKMVSTQNDNLQNI